MVLTIGKGFFYDTFCFIVWYVLERVSDGLVMYEHVLPQQPALTEMTAGETVFKLRVEEMLSNARTPTYRQIVVEVSSHGIFGFIFIYGGLNLYE